MYLGSVGVRIKHSVSLASTSSIKHFTAISIFQCYNFAFTFQMVIISLTSARSGMETSTVGCGYECQEGMQIDSGARVSLGSDANPVMHTSQKVNYANNLKSLVVENT